MDDGSVACKICGLKAIFSEAFFRDFLLQYRYLYQAGGIRKFLFPYYDNDLCSPSSILIATCRK